MLDSPESSPPPKRIMGATAPPPPSALIPTKPSVASVSSHESPVLSAKPIGVIQKTEASDNPLDALLARVSTDGTQSSFASVLGSSASLAPEDTSKVSTCRH
eukprot:TRINITY_DN789_c0_g1_i1.p1 TRINITY_DN789_c0_g1~~TRINITY_DN789_c0_g1_i1.p1  ORF type:complete len:102 (-),score=11.58 TRINITY_DN789_c0_g1_i1:112-417(-)